MMSSQPSAGFSIPTLIFPDFIRESLVAEILHNNSAADKKVFNKNNYILLSEIEYVAHFVMSLLFDDCINKIKSDSIEAKERWVTKIKLKLETKRHPDIGHYYDFDMSPSNYFHWQLMTTYVDLDLLASEIANINCLTSSDDKFFEANKILIFCVNLDTEIKSLKQKIPDKLAPEQVTINLNRQQIAKSHLKYFKDFLEKHRYVNHGIDPVLDRKFANKIANATAAEAVSGGN